MAFVLSQVLQEVAADQILLASFDRAAGGTHSWRQMNDPLDTFTGTGCGMGEGGGSVLIRGYPLTKDHGRFLQHRFVQS